jgi:hypothetical protein
MTSGEEAAALSEKEGMCPYDCTMALILNPEVDGTNRSLLM